MKIARIKSIKHSQIRANSQALNTALRNYSIHLLSNEHSNLPEQYIQQVKIKGQDKYELLLSAMSRSFEHAMNCQNTYRLAEYENSDNTHFQEWHSKSCKTKSCLHCLRNKSADVINGYSHLNEKKLFFLTLTVSNCVGVHLQDTLDAMYSTIRRINDNIRKNPLLKNSEFSGIRKLEITFNATAFNYHPHFHILIDSEEVAEEILSQWLSITSKLGLSTAQQGQDIRPASNNGEDFLELCKYFTKLYKQGSTPDISSFFHILTNLRYKRIIQPFGKAKKNIEDSSVKFIDYIDDYYISFADGRYTQYIPDVHQHYDNNPHLYDNDILCREHIHHPKAEIKLRAKSFLTVSPSEAFQFPDYL